MADPWSEIKAIYKHLRAVDDRRAAREACAADLLACSHDPDYRDGDGVIVTWDDPLTGAGFAFAVYRGERVGKAHTWEGVPWPGVRR